MQRDTRDLPATAHTTRMIGLFLGLILFAASLIVSPPADWSVEAWRVLGCIALMVCWWISEAIPVYATGLAPLVALPLMSVATPAEAAAPYGDPLIFLFLGGFMIAQSIQKFGLHRRIALRLLSLTGTGLRHLVGGFMLACAFLSMWISNTATAVMMLPIALSVVSLIEESGLEVEVERRFERALLLSIAYACSLGGIATLIGTPPNAILAAYLAREHDMVITFASWIQFALPLSIVLLFITWFVLTRLFRLPDQPLNSASSLITEGLKRLGPIDRGERMALGCFILAAVLWIGRGMLEVWLPWLKLSDAGIAIGVTLLLFALPVDSERGIFALNWSDARQVPWGVLLLFGGGLSLARAIDETGLAGHIGSALVAMDAWPYWLVVSIAVAMIVFLTEVMSNTATTAAFVPIAAALAIALGHDPLSLAVPVALAASCAFMLPSATPPNAVVFGSGRLTINQMARAGFLFNLIAITILAMVAATPLINLLQNN